MTTLMVSAVVLWLVATFIGVLLYCRALGQDKGE